MTSRPQDRNDPGAPAARRGPFSHAAAALLVRPAGSADIAAITGIYRESILESTVSFEYEPPDEAEMGRRMAALAESGHPYLVAEIGGTVAGYAYAGPYRARAAYRFTVEDTVYIAGSRRGMGVGRTLLSRLVEASAERGFRQMIAVISDGAAAGSVALHRACGFAEIGTLPAVGWKHETWCATILMQRPLGAGDASPPEDRASP